MIRIEEIKKICDPFTIKELINNIEIVYDVYFDEIFDNSTISNPVKDISIYETLSRIMKLLKYIEKEENNDKPEKI